MSASVDRIIRPYGDDARQVVEWFLPVRSTLESTSLESPWVVLIHGGFWRPRWSRDLEEDVAIDLARNGFAVCNIEYRDYRHPWPATFDDVAAAIDMGEEQAKGYGADVSRSAICGHSAGGTLALWAISRRRLPANAPGASNAPHVFTHAVVTAPVALLAEASITGVGDGAVDQLMDGTPAQVGKRFKWCDPSQLNPDSQTQITVLHGDLDEDVPLLQSRRYVDQLKGKGLSAGLISFTGSGHYEILDPKSAMSLRRKETLSSLLSAPT